MANDVKRLQSGECITPKCGGQVAVIEVGYDPDYRWMIPDPPANARRVEWQTGTHRLTGNAGAVVYQCPLCGSVVTLNLVYKNQKVNWVK